MRNKVILITGLSCAGKTTLAKALVSFLNEKNPEIKTLHLDGDELRKERPNLGYSKLDRFSNMLAGISKANDFIIRQGKENVIVVLSMIVPYVDHREDARKLVENYTDAKFIEVFLNTSLETCERRDTKGLYKKARAGEIQDFTGIDSPYETPTTPLITIHERTTLHGEMTIDRAVDMVYSSIYGLK